MDSTDGTMSVGPPSSAWPNRDSRSSATLAAPPAAPAPVRSLSFTIESADRSRSCDMSRLWSRLTVSRSLRIEPRPRWCRCCCWWCKSGWSLVRLLSVVLVVVLLSLGLIPCWARYRSILLIRFCGGGVKCCDRSSGNSHGKDVDVCAKLITS